MTGSEPFRLTASEAQAKFKDGSLTVEEYAKSLLQRIEARDSVTHAWAYLNPNAVLERARELDRIPVQKRGPLHGVAVGVKDVILTKDMPTQYNSPIYEGDAPKIDAASIMTLRENGALIFGMLLEEPLKQLELTQTPCRQDYDYRIRSHHGWPLVRRSQNCKPA